MEDILISSTPSKLAMRKDSHVISKFKPKVRIIHIFSPEIIKTDVANFRELVQRLTGKPGDHETNCIRKKKTSKNKKIKKSMQLQDGLFPASFIQTKTGEKLKMEEENDQIWGGGSENSSDFLDGFADFNGFIHDLSDNFSLAPSLQSSHMDVFGADMHLEFTN